MGRSRWTRKDPSSLTTAPGRPQAKPRPIAAAAAAAAVASMPGQSSSQTGRAAATPATPRRKENNGGKPTPSARIHRMRLLLRMRSVIGRSNDGDFGDGEAVKESSARSSIAKVMFKQQPIRTQQRKQGTREPDVVIRLTTCNKSTKDEVQYSFTTGKYEPVQDEDPLLDLLTLPSRVVHKSEAPLSKLLMPTLPPPPPSPSPESPGDSEAEEGGGESWRPGETGQRPLLPRPRADTQPNPFNFSERVSQTTRLTKRSLGIQTSPPPSTTFSRCVGLYKIYQAYRVDYQKILEQEMEMEKKEKEKERGTTKPKAVLDPIVVVRPPSPPPPPGKLGGPDLRLPGLLWAARVVERMVSQNTYDDISQDFKYWEDGSDEFRHLEGSLLPLWKFHHDRSRTFIVSDVCWSPVYPDLLAAAYTTGDIGGPEGAGMLCLYTLKNPATPERVFHTPCGVLCLDFHPKHGNVVAAGWSDGTVVMYDVRSSTRPIIIASTCLNDKHLLPVTQVRWMETEIGEDLCFFSVSLDGRLTQWTVHAGNLQFMHILDFNVVEHLSGSVPVRDKVPLEGVATSMAFRPDDITVVVVGVDTGVVFQCSTTCPTHSLFVYPAHSSPVRKVAWNAHHTRIFLSCSVDWTIKIWLQHTLAPLVVLDVGGAVAGVTWSPFSSSVFVAVTDEGRVYVYDLFLRRCRPLCVQSLLQRRRVAATSVAFNPFHPIVVVGGERGHLVALKLSPNLRKPHKDAKGADAQRLRELELYKMERLIATSNNTSG
ncbi:dynein intermediate chain 2, ciliary-like isoform X3 [Portunus trituberculatus]|uniref:dynein intermediate chain 2, ciliary-like isoform X3 n=1 Tax=Portunus trituberculatus TaxID=210409 RepID=UPI001E1CF8C0|nr:dynein intermediate chain 2, ciliary-like isoform X3 [Portunus trituberculatus]